MINFQTMKFRLIGLGVALVVVGALSRVLFGLPLAQEQLHAQLSTQQVAMTAYIAHDIDQSILGRRALVAQLAAALPPVMLHQPQRLAGWLSERQRLNPLFNGPLQLIGPDGSVPGAGRAWPGPEHISDQAWFQAALTAATPVISRPQRGPDGEPIIIVAAALRDAGQRVLGVLAGVARLNDPAFLGRLQDRRLDANGEFLLISPQDQLFVGASDPAMVLQPVAPERIRQLHQRAMSAGPGSASVVDAEDLEMLSAVAQVPSSGWLVLWRMPAAQAFRPISTLRGFVVTSSVLTLAVIVAGLLFALPRILHPLTDAAQAMREMADGSRALAPLPLRRNDEVGSLVLGFNHLVARLGEQEAALKASEARLERMAHHDALTGLFNRTILQQRLQQALAHAERGGAPFALLFCDLDCFKPINDEYGHGAGDAVLIEVAARLSQGRRRVDTVARLGGDEFVLLLAELDDVRGGAEQVARQCLTALAAPYEVGDRTFTLSASIGVACYQGAPVSASQLMSQADIAMYQAKRAGKNALCFFDAAAVGIAF